MEASKDASCPAPQSQDSPYPFRFVVRMVAAYAALIIGWFVVSHATWRVASADPGHGTFLHNATDGVFVLVSIAFVAFLLHRTASWRERIETAFHRGERHFRALIENSADAIALLSSDGTILYASPTATRILGYSTEEMVGKNVRIIVPSEDQSAFAALLDASARQPGVRIEASARTRHKDGSLRYFEGYFTNLLHDSAVRAIVVNYHDCTKQHHTEAALRDTEARFRLVVEQPLVGIYAIQDDRFVYANPGVAAIFGYTQDEVDRGLDIFSFVAPSDRAVVVKNLAKRLNGEAKSLHYTFRGRRKDGDLIEVEVLGTRGEWNGRPAVLGVLLDITDRKRAETDRHRLFSLSIDMLCVTDLTGRLREINPAWTRTLGWSEEELHKKRWTEFTHPDDHEATTAMIQQLALGKAACFFSNRLQCKDGSYRRLSWSLFPVPAEELVFGVARDITDIKP
jgi:PAS domain S-box-containing protein